jgi:hypothetical protein
MAGYGRRVGPQRRRFANQQIHKPADLLCASYRLVSQAGGIFKSGHSFGKIGTSFVIRETSLINSESPGTESALLQSWKVLLYHLRVWISAV